MQSVVFAQGLLKNKEEQKQVNSYEYHENCHFEDRCNLLKGSKPVCRKRLKMCVRGRNINGITNIKTEA